MFNPEIPHQIAQIKAKRTKALELTKSNYKNIRYGTGFSSAVTLQSVALNPITFGSSSPAGTFQSFNKKKEKNIRYTYIREPPFPN